jgi:hypothetical protein
MEYKIELGPSAMSKPLGTGPTYAAGMSH